MQRVPTNITLAIAVVISVGCASTPRVIAPEATTSFKRIGVISVTAQTFRRQHVGFTVFGNEEEKIDSSTWDIDNKYEQQVSNELKTLGGFEVISGTYSRPEFLHVNDLNGPWDAPAFRGPNWKAIEGPIRNYCKDNKVDAILTVFAVDGPDFIGGTNQYVRGAGIYTRGFGDSVRISTLHLISGVALVDCQTATPAAVRGLANSQEGYPGQVLRASPLTPIPIHTSRVPLGQLSTEQIASIKEMLGNLPTNAWGPTVRALLGK